MVLTRGKRKMSTQRRGRKPKLSSRTGRGKTKLLSEADWDNAELSSETDQGETKLSCEADRGKIKLLSGTDGKKIRHVGQSDGGKTCPPGRVAFTMLVPVNKSQQQFQCGLCGHGFDASEDLVSHLENHTKLFQCGYCFDSFDSREALYKHVDAHDIFVCLKIDRDIVKVPDAITSKSANANVNGESGTQETDGCDSGTDGKMSSSFEIKRQDVPSSNQPKTYVCRTCGFTFKRMTNLKKHCLEEHSDVRPYFCMQCPSQFKQANHLKDHMNSVHRNNRPYVCPLCKDDFKMERYLMVHINRVHGQDPFSVLGKSRARFNQSNGDEEGSMTGLSPSKQLKLDMNDKEFEQQAAGKVQGQNEDDSDTAVDGLMDDSAGSNGEHHSGGRKDGVENMNLAGVCAARKPIGHSLKIRTRRRKRMRSTSMLEIEAYQCGECRVIFTTAIKLRDHWKSTHNTCDCGQIVHDPCEMDCHRKSVHGRKVKYRPYVCALCEAMFRVYIHLQNHIGTVHSKEHHNQTSPEKEISYAPSIEGVANNGQESLPSHAFKCDVCDKRFLTALNLRDHWQCAHSTCDCGENVSDPLEMDSHKRTVHGSKCKYRPFMCAICDGRFQVFRYLRDHMDRFHKKKHQSSLNPKECIAEKDAATLVDGERVNGQVENTGVDKLFMCNHCKKRFATNLALRHHWECNHSTCECGESVEDARAMEKHRMAAHEQLDKYSPFACGICGKGFLFHSALRAHLDRKHRKMAWYRGEEENETGNHTGSELPANVNLSKPFKCAFCDKLFSSSLKLRDHWRSTHSTCQCGVSVKSPQAMESHKNSMHGEKDKYKPFICALCSSKTRFHRYLSSHMQKAHGKILVNARNVEEVEDAETAVTATSLFEDMMGGVLTDNISSGSPFRCGHCSQLFASAVKLRDHWQATHSVCECGITISDPRSVDGHMKSVHKQIVKYKPYVCDLCGSSFRVYRYLRDHMDRTHGRKAKTPMNKDVTQPPEVNLGGIGLDDMSMGSVEVGEEVTAATIIEGMINGSHPTSAPVQPTPVTNRYKCGLCLSLFPTVTKIREHWECMHSKCVCGELFEDACEMYSHQKAIHGEANDRKSYRPFVCAICGAGFRVSRYVNLHYLRSHKRSGLPRKKYPRPRRLRAFAGNYRCLVCSQSFPYSIWLARHCLSAHGIERPFSCLHCPAKFKIRGHLLCHTESLHGNTTPHTCPLCPRQFKSKKHLRAHLVRSKAHPPDQVAQIPRNMPRKKGGKQPVFQQVQVQHVQIQQVQQIQQIQQIQQVQAAFYSQ